MDPPDFYDDIRRDQDARDASKQHQDDPGPSTKRAREMPPTEGDLLAIGREIQNRSKMRVGSDLSEDMRFRAYFGCSAEVALIGWNMMGAHGLTPDGGQLVHMLWALYFLMVYPGATVAGGTLGGEGKAVDPKTLSQYIWPFIQALAGLEMHLVRK
jgi:hypothetical protein